MTGDVVAGFYFFEFRAFLGADFLGEAAAGAETAAAGRVHRGRNVPFQNDALAVLLDFRVRVGDGGEERLGIGVQRVLVKLVALGQLDDDPQIHHRDSTI